MKILFLPRFGTLGASSRLRLWQYLPWFDAEAIEFVVSPLFDDGMLLRKYQHGGYGLLALLLAYWRRLQVLVGVGPVDVVWIEKEALPWFPAWLEKRLLGRAPYVLDFDDATFHNYDLHRFAVVRSLLGQRIDTLMSGARLVVAGNRYLANRAFSAHAPWVEVMPTVVDLARYMPKQAYSIGTKLRIVWIGSPSTVQYLLDLAVPLRCLAEMHPFTLRVIGGGMITIPGVEVESFPWTAETEAALIVNCDVGIMPLRDTSWEQGKCAYKLIQYMVCGLPVVASAIGANCDVVADEETGLLASTPGAWVEKLAMLLCDAELRQRLGQAGRARVEVEYCLQRSAPKLVGILTDAGARQLCVV